MHIRKTKGTVVEVVVIQQISHISLVRQANFSYTIEGDLNDDEKSA
mgnify:CR=1 FL=1